MIQVRAYNDGGVIRPLRYLTDEERNSVTGEYCDGEYFYYFQQGDTGMKEEINEIKSRVERLAQAHERRETENTNFHKQYTEDREVLKSIHTALIGNNLGQKGLIDRLKDTEEWVEKDRQLKQKITGGMLVIGSIWTIIWTAIVIGVQKWFS